MNFFSALTVFVPVSELVKNISETVKNFFECVEIGKRIKAEQKIRSTTAYVDERAATRFAVTVTCYTIELQGSGNRKPLLPNNSPAIYLSQDIYSNNGCAWAAGNVANISVEAYNERYTPTKEMLLKHAADSVIIVEADYSRTVTNLLFYMMNIVPCNDDKCYVLKFRIEHEANADMFSRFAPILSSVLSEASRVFQKYRETVFRNQNRLELDARILSNMGYSNVEIRQVSDGFGLELPLSSRSYGITPRLVIKLPYDYPRVKPLVLLKDNDTYTPIDLNVDWNPNYTIGHIVRAISEKGI